MKTFLKVDLGVQIVCYLMMATGVAILIAFNEIEFLFYSFLVLGSWQLLSAMGIMLWFKQGAGRKEYFLTSIMYVFGSVILIFFWPIYFLGAFLISIWYFKITCDHLQKIRYSFRSFWDLEF